MGHLTQRRARRNVRTISFLYETESGGVLPGVQKIDILAHLLAREQLERSLRECGDETPLAVRKTRFRTDGPEIAWSIEVG